MLANPTRKSMLDWLQLSPTLLSGNPVRAVAPADVVEARQPVVAVSQPEADELHRGLISRESVAPGLGMTFLPSTSPRPQDGEAGEPWQQIVRVAYPQGGRAYDSLGNGGSQSVALAEMVRYVTTRL